MDSVIVLELVSKEIKIKEKYYIIARGINNLVGTSIVTT